ncbi:MAG: hypothetical protein AAGI01_16735 [Myxococcota bacterium]
MYRPPPIAAAKAPDPQAPGFWSDLFLAPALIFTNAGWMRMLAIYLLPFVAGISWVGILYISNTFEFAPMWLVGVLAGLPLFILAIFGPVFYSMTVIMRAATGHTRLPGPDEMDDLWPGIFFAMSSMFLLLVTYFTPPALLWLFFDWRVALLVFALSCFLFPMAWMLTCVSHSVFDAGPITALVAVLKAPWAYLAILVLNAAIFIPFVILELLIDWGEVTLIGFAVYGIGRSGAVHVLNILTAFLLGRLHFHYYGTFKNDGPPRFDPDPELAATQKRRRTIYFVTRAAISTALWCLSAAYLLLFGLMPTHSPDVAEERFLAIANDPTAQLARKMVPEAKTSKALDDTAATVEETTKDAIQNIKENVQDASRD